MSYESPKCFKFKPLLTFVHPQQSDAITRMFLHISAEQCVDAGLITASLLLVPFENIAIHAYGELRFLGHKLQAPPSDRPGKQLGCQFRRIGIIILIILQRMNPLPISP